MNKGITAVLKFVVVTSGIWLAFIVLCVAADDQVVRRVTSYHDGKFYEATVRQSDVDRAPRWPADQLYPPMSAGLAQVAARKHVAELIPGSSSWPILRVSLEPIGEEDHWIYIVEFRREPSIDIGSLSRPFRVVVLMNGHPVRPKIELQKGEGKFN